MCKLKEEATTEREKAGMCAHWRFQSTDASLTLVSGHAHVFEITASAEAVEYLLQGKWLFIWKASCSHFSQGPEHTKALYFDFGSSAAIPPSPTYEWEEQDRP